MQTQRAALDHPPACAIAWLAETEVGGETRVAIVWSQHAYQARLSAMPVLEQPLVEHVHVKPVTFKGFSKREN
jgi:hypothetical protein